MQVPLDVLFAGMILMLLLKFGEATAIAVYSKNSICATDGAKVCATNGTDYLLFPNECRLKEANQLNKALEAGFEKVSMGFCQPQCNLICPTYVLPICAIQPTTGFRRSFNNPCELSRDACLNNIAWKIHNEGQCVPQLQAVKKREPIPCLEKFNPVCAIFAGVKSTFNNECLVNAENDKTGKTWTVFSQGLCAEDYKNYGYNNDYADKQKYITARSYDEEKYLAKYAGVDNLGEDVAYIIAPPSFQTDFVDEAYSGKFLNPVAPIKTYRYSKPSTPKIVSKSAVQGAKHFRTTKTHDDDSFGKIRSCKYGSQPICGSYGGKTRSFGNICELMLRNILLNQTWTLAYAGKCITSTCPEVCTKEYAPLCVSKNGANFTIVNQCFLELNQCQDGQSTWKVIAQGECMPEVQPVIMTASAATITKPLTSVHETAANGFRFTSKYVTSTSLSNKFDNKSTTATSQAAAAAREAAVTTTIPASIATKSTTTTTTIAKTPATTTNGSTTTLFPITTDSGVDTEKSIITSNESFNALTTTGKASISSDPSLTAVTAPTNTSLSYELAAATKSRSSEQTTTATSPPFDPNKKTTISLSDSTTTTPIQTFVVSAKQSQKPSSSRSSVYGAKRNSVIMRLVKSRDLGPSNSTWTSSWRRVFSK